MKNIFYILIILIPFFGFSQKNPDTLEFNPMTIVGEVSSIDVKHLQKVDNLGKKDYFFTEQYNNNYGLFLVRKENGKWIIYDFVINYGSNTKTKEFKFETNRFLSIQVFRFPSGSCESTYGKIILFDLVNNKWTDFWNYNRFQCKDEAAEECKANFTIKGKFLKIKSSKKSNDGLYCFESGIYEYRKRKFIKIK